MHRHTQTNVLIAGAGPAGLACAIAAANHGLQVDVVDAQTPGIDKACGEGLMPNSIATLNLLGFNLPRDLDSFNTAPLHGLRFLQNGTSVESPFPANPGRGIRRTVLHQLLFQRAASLGVRFHWQNSIQSITQTSSFCELRTNRQTLRARYLIGADGHQSRIAKHSGLTQSHVHSRRIGIRQHYTIAPWTNFVEVYWSDLGQAYVTPISSSEVCVAFVSTNKIPHPTEALQSFPALAHRLALASTSDAPRGSITFHRTLRRVTIGNIALIGDASGSVDAITGEGLYLCFRQASALAQALHANDFASYQHAHRRIQLAPGLMSRSLLLLDRSPHLRKQVLQTLERHPIVFQRLLEVHIGHRACIFPGIDELLATGLHLLTN